MNILSFIIYCVMVTFTPGPTNIVILSATHQHGARKAMGYVGGATAAFGLLLAISALLGHVLIAVMPKMLQGMQSIGSLYMLYLAYKLLHSQISDEDDPRAASFWSGFLMQFINPKVVLFTMTVLPSFVFPYYTGAAALSAFVALVTGIGFLAFTAWVVLGRAFRRVLQAHYRVTNALMAGFLVYAALMISGITDKVGW